MGMITAAMLLHQGFDVKIIAHVFPKEKGITNGLTDHMASQIAGGLFLPHGYHLGGDVDNSRMIKDSWETFKLIADSKLYSLLVPSTFI